MAYASLQDILAWNILPRFLPKLTTTQANGKKRSLATNFSSEHTDGTGGAISMLKHDRYTVLKVERYKHLHISLRVACSVSNFKICSCTHPEPTCGALKYCTQYKIQSYAFLKLFCMPRNC